MVIYRRMYRSVYSFTIYGRTRAETRKDTIIQGTFYNSASVQCTEFRYIDLYLRKLLIRYRSSTSVLRLRD